MIEIHVHSVTACDLRTHQKSVIITVIMGIRTFAVHKCSYYIICVYNIEMQSCAWFYRNNKCSQTRAFCLNAIISSGAAQIRVNSAMMFWLTGMILKRF